MKSLQPAVFLDRDGTLIEDCGHLSRLEDVVFLPGTIEALQRLQNDFVFFIVTHQPGVAAGVITAGDVERVNNHIVSQLAECGIEIRAVYVCPHDRSEGCACIKPEPFFLDLAAKEYNIDLKRSFVVGDHPHDVELAERAGAQGIYVCTGHGMRHLAELPDNKIVVFDIKAAAEWIFSCYLQNRQDR